MSNNLLVRLHFLCVVEKLTNELLSAPPQPPGVGVGTPLGDNHNTGKMIGNSVDKELVEEAKTWDLEPKARDRFGGF